MAIVSWLAGPLEEKSETTRPSLRLGAEPYRTYRSTSALAGEPVVGISRFAAPSGTTIRYPEAPAKRRGTGTALHRCRKRSIDRCAPGEEPERNVIGPRLQRRIGTRGNGDALIAAIRGGFVVRDCIGTGEFHVPAETHKQIDVGVRRCRGDLDFELGG